MPNLISKIDIPYWSMKKGNSHEPEMYQSQRKVSIGDFVSTRMPKQQNHFSGFDFAMRSTPESSESKSTNPSSC